jgi:hypothetical protein
VAEGACWDGTQLLPCWQALTDPPLGCTVCRLHLAGLGTCGLGGQHPGQQVSKEYMATLAPERNLHTNMVSMHHALLSCVQQCPHPTGLFKRENLPITVENGPSAPATASNSSVAMRWRSENGSSQLTCTGRDEKATLLNVPDPTRLRNLGKWPQNPTSTGRSTELNSGWLQKTCGPSQLTE